MAKAQLLFALSAAAHQDRIYQRLQWHEMQREMQHAAAGVRSGLAALRHHVLVPTGQFFGGDSTAFFDVQYARSSAVAHRHIGAACWLVTARLYNLKRPKSQFCSTMRAFCMIGICRDRDRDRWSVGVGVGGGVGDTGGG